MEAGAWPGIEGMPGKVGIPPGPSPMPPIICCSIFIKGSSAPGMSPGPIPSIPGIPPIPGKPAKGLAPGSEAVLGSKPSIICLSWSSEGPCPGVGKSKALFIRGRTVVLGS